MTEYHKPVMLEACLEGLDLKPDGVYVDATFGGGGHSRAILKKLNEEGRLLAFDQDPDAAKNALTDERFTFLPYNFQFLKRTLRLEGIKRVDGILADLGVSSHQLDEEERGFSYRFGDVMLDMRMSQSGEKTAATILQTYDEQTLQRIFGEYGEVRNSKTLAQAIVAERGLRPIRTINDFLKILDPLVRGKRPKYLSQVFQALRIEVNDEIGALQQFLKDCLDVLQPQGRLVVLSYHSLEDRLVKNFMKKGTFDDGFITDDFGNIFRPFEIVTKKANEASETEVAENSRARSAKLRVAAKQMTLEDFNNATNHHG